MQKKSNKKNPKKNQKKTKKKKTNFENHFFDVRNKHSFVTEPIVIDDPTRHFSPTFSRCCNKNLFLAQKNSFDSFFFSITYSKITKRRQNHCENTVRHVIFFKKVSYANLVSQIAPLSHGQMGKIFLASNFQTFITQHPLKISTRLFHHNQPKTVKNLSQYFQIHISHVFIFKIECVFFVIQRGGRHLAAAILGVPLGFPSIRRLTF